MPQPKALKPISARIAAPRIERSRQDDVRRGLGQLALGER